MSLPKAGGVVDLKFTYESSAHVEPEVNVDPKTPFVSEVVRSERLGKAQSFEKFSRTLILFMYKFSSLGKINLP